MSKIKLDKIEDAIKAINDGEIIIVVDDENRENEGDFITAAETINSEKINSEKINSEKIYQPG